jgi:hypothetical protein
MLLTVKRVMEVTCEREPEEMMNKREEETPNPEKNP